MLKMEKPCYCCEHRTADAAGSNENSNANLNVALRELEVLNVASEKVRLPGLSSAVSKIVMRPNIPNAVSPKRIQGGFCVLHMNKRFVTNFVTSSMTFGPKPTEPSARSRLCECKAGSTTTYRSSGGNVASSSSHLKLATYTPVACQDTVNSFKVRTSRTRFRFQKPYEMPWLRKLEERVRAYNWDREKSPPEEPSSESNGCKSGSNPSTPSKTASSGGLMRSRSLDNITSKRWTDVDDVVVVLESKDIENVAQKMKDLQVM